ncbi:MAG: TolC family protein [Gemmatimonadetes bacterium]|nr:TolC family protein [Gemmatimonadota bacterium]
MIFSMRSYGDARACVRAALVAVAAVVAARPAGAQDRRVVDLTLQSALELAQANSYRVQQLQLGIERQRHQLAAERAGLKSRVELTFTLPQFSSISEHQWNSVLERRELVREDSRLWQAEMSLRQPVILFGYPTNGYLSLNNRMYRYSQIDGATDVTYYNRYYARYEQPIFQPNQLRNDLEEAELDLENAELVFQDDVVSLLAGIARDYYGLLDVAYDRVVYQRQVTQLEEAVELARTRVAADSSRGLEATQVQVALANARERLQRAGSEFRLSASRLKQRLGLQERDSLVVDPALDVAPLSLDLDAAMQFAMTLPPRMRFLDIRQRRDAITMDGVKARNAFRLNIDLTYGREMQNEVARDLWSQPSNTYTVGVRGYLPIWDWGARKERIEAQRVSARLTELQIEDTRRQIEATVRNLVQSALEYQQRALAMEQNLALSNEISRATAQQYGSGRATVLDLLQAFDREAATADNFLEAFLGYRRTLIELSQATYYDFETATPITERYRLQNGEPEASQH